MDERETSLAGETRSVMSAGRYPAVGAYVVTDGRTRAKNRKGPVVS